MQHIPYIPKYTSNQPFKNDFTQSFSLAFIIRKNALILYSFSEEKEVQNGLFYHFIYKTLVVNWSNMLHRKVGLISEGQRKAKESKAKATNTLKANDIFFMVSLVFLRSFVFVCRFFVVILLLERKSATKATKMSNKESIKLRKRKMPTGNTSLYLDIYRNGKREYEYLRLYLIPEKNRQDKEKNRETMKLAEAIKAKRTVEL